MHTPLRSCGYGTHRVSNPDRPRCGRMNAAFQNALVIRVAQMVAREKPKAEIRKTLLSEGLSEEEAFFTYMAGKTYLALHEKG